MDFKITGLPVTSFASLLHLGDDALCFHGVERGVADAPNA
jgi:hypothetical protein